MIVPAQLEQHERAKAVTQRMTQDIAIRSKRPPVVRAHIVDGCSVTVRAWEPLSLPAPKPEPAIIPMEALLAQYRMHDIAIGKRGIPILPGEIVRRIKRDVAAATGITVVDITSERRIGRLIVPRHFAMYLAKVRTGRSLPVIGRMFGGRDHTTVLHAVRKIERMIADGSLPPELMAMLPKGEGA